MVFFIHRITHRINGFIHSFIHTHHGVLNNLFQIDESFGDREADWLVSSLN